MISDSVGFLKLLSFAFILFIFCHIMACFFYLIPKLDGFGPNTWVVVNGFLDKSNMDVTF